MYFLDTNTCIYFLKGMYPSIQKHFLDTSSRDIKIPAIVKAELLLGAYKSQTKEETSRKIEVFLSPFEIVPFTDEMSYEYAEIRKDLERTGKIIGANDLFIAATVRTMRGILVTHNTGEFSRVPGLKLTDWVEAEK